MGAVVMVVLSVILTVLHAGLAFYGASIGDDAIFWFNLVPACLWAANIALWSINVANDL